MAELCSHLSLLRLNQNKDLLPPYCDQRMPVSVRACTVVVLFVCTHGSVVEPLVRWRAVFVYVPSAPMVCHYASDYWPGMCSPAFLVCVNTKYAKGRPFRFSRLPVQSRPKVRPRSVQSCANGAPVLQFLREDMQYQDSKGRQNNFHQADLHISVADMWITWKSSEGNRHCTLATPLFYQEKQSLM